MFNEIIESNKYVIENAKYIQINKDEIKKFANEIQEINIKNWLYNSPYNLFNENVETIKALKDYIDVYLPDFKYANNELGRKYSNINNYFEVTSKAITEMYKQVGPPQLDENGIIKRGLIIRHLILPNEIENSKNVLKWIVDNIGKEVYVSIMAQYFPTYKAKKIKELNRKINNEEYKQIEDYIYEIGIENGYMQDLGDHEEEYVPDFKNSLT